MHINLLVIYERALGIVVTSQKKKQRDYNKETMNEYVAIK